VKFQAAPRELSESVFIMLALLILLHAINTFAATTLAVLAASENLQLSLVTSTTLAPEINITFTAI
jgi:hypothetical protein